MKTESLLVMVCMACAFICEAELLTPMDASASSYALEVTHPTKLINNSGLSLPVSTNSTHFFRGDELFWVSGAGIKDTTGWLAFDLGETKRIESAVIWQYNEEYFENRGVKDFDVLVSSDNVNWSTILSNQYLDRPPMNQRMLQEVQIFDFGTPTNARYVKIDILSNHGHSSYTGLSEVKFIGTAIPEPTSAILIMLTGGLLWFKTRVLGGR